MTLELIVKTTFGMERWIGNLLSHQKSAHGFRLSAREPNAPGRTLKLRVKSTTIKTDVGLTISDKEKGINEKTRNNFVLRVFFKMVQP